MATTPKSQEVTHSIVEDFASQSIGYWLAMAGKLFLALAIGLYLGVHSLNYFSGTFKGDQEIFSWLGLCTTSIAFVIWILIFKYAAPTNFHKTIALVMMFVSGMGEFYVAGNDIINNTAQRVLDQTLTYGEIQTMSWVVAFLAYAQGLAFLADILGIDILKLLQRKPRTQQVVTNESVTQSPGVIVSETYRKVSYSDKTNQFYCPPKFLDKVKEYLANPTGYATVEEFLSEVNATA